MNVILGALEYLLFLLFLSSTYMWNWDWFWDGMAENIRRRGAF